MARRSASRLSSRRPCPRRLEKPESVVCHAAPRHRHGFHLQSAPVPKRLEVKPGRQGSVAGAFPFSIPVFTLGDGGMYLHSSKASNPDSGDLGPWGSEVYIPTNDYSSH